MVKKLYVIYFIIMLGMVLPGCNGADSKQMGADVQMVYSEVENGRGEVSFVYGSSDYTSINPALYEHGEINSFLFSGLTAHDEDGKIVPLLAESWIYDDFMKTYTFFLRDDVIWHDGEKFTAYDVEYTLNAIKNPDNVSEIASNYEDITNIEVLSETKLKITLSTPNAAILDYLTIGILPKHLLFGKDLITDEFNYNPVGTGPYQLESWDAGQSIILIKNKDYFEKEPEIDKIIFKIVEDTKVRTLQLKSGELDMAQITPLDAEEFKNNKDYNLYIIPTADYRGILYNFKSPLFQAHRELPNALSYAVDRQAIVDAVLLGHGEPAYSPLQAGSYCNQNIEKYQYNPAKAKSELEKEGWVLGVSGIYEKNGEALRFKINCAEGDQVRIDMAAICAQQFREIGVDASVSVNAQTDWENQEAYLIGWGSPFDPDDHTYKVFGTGRGANYNSYSNVQVDELLKLARETEAEEERMEYYQEFQEVLSKDLPFTFLAYVDAVYVSKKNIIGITPEKVLGHHGVGVFWNIVDWSME